MVRRACTAAILLFASLSGPSCGKGEGEDTISVEETAFSVCPNLDGTDCPACMDGKYWCDGCGRVWNCGDHDSQRFWTGGNRGFCECVNEDGSWNYETCPEER